VRSWSRRSWSRLLDGLEVYTLACKLRNSLGTVPLSCFTQGAIDLKEAEAQAVTNNIAFSGASSLTAVSPLIIAMQIFLQFIFRF
jgi:hypothetical protein